MENTNQAARSLVSAQGSCGLEQIGCGQFGSGSTQRGRQTIEQSDEIGVDLGSDRVTQNSTEFSSRIASTHSSEVGQDNLCADFCNGDRNAGGRNSGAAHVRTFSQSSGRNSRVLRNLNGLTGIIADVVHSDQTHH